MMRKRAVRFLPRPAALRGCATRRYLPTAGLCPRIGPVKWKLLAPALSTWLKLPVTVTNRVHDFPFLPGLRFTHDFPLLTPVSTRWTTNLVVAAAESL